MSVELNRTPNIRPSELLAYIDLKTSASCERHAEQLTAEVGSAGVQAEGGTAANETFF